MTKGQGLPVSAYENNTWGIPAEMMHDGQGGKVSRCNSHMPQCQFLHACNQQHRLLRHSTYIAGSPCRRLSQQACLLMP